VPAWEPQGAGKTASCTKYAGTTAEMQVECYAHNNPPWQGTPVPVQTPFACPGSVYFPDSYEQCWCRATSNTTSDARFSCWIDRYPVPVGNEAP
jgi:hypothetical protein